MEAYATVLTYAIPGFVLLIIIEALIARWKGIEVNRPMDTISSLSSGMTNTLKSLMGLSVVILSYGWMVDHLAIYTIESTLGIYLAAFIGLDFAGYWSHRFNHVINIFWNRHIVHHSSEEFNLSCALRQSISAFVGVYFFLYIPIALLGVPAKVVAVIAPLHLFAQFWYHTRLINKMGWLEHIIVTPSHHRVHHAINPEYIDKNFSEIFIIWDKLFGTFQGEMKDIPPVYGVKRPVQTWNPFLINFMHVWQLIKDAWSTRNWVDKVRIWFMPTGWRPADVQANSPLQLVDDVYAMEKYDSQTSTALQYWTWFQLVFNNLLIYYLLSTIADYSFPNVLLYAAFLMVSIFGYTSLMDKHRIAVGAEFIKLVFGSVLIWRMGGWFTLDQIIPGATVMIAVYLVLSLVISIYFIKTEGENRFVQVESVSLTD